MIQDSDDILELARHLADDVLFPSANDVDVAGVVPRSSVFGSRPAIRASLIKRLLGPSE